MARSSMGSGHVYASEKIISGRCNGKAHRRDTLSLPGRRVLVSRQWSNKTLPDHKADRVEFVRQLLAQVGIVKPDTSHLKLSIVQPADRSAPPRDHLVIPSSTANSAIEYQRLSTS